MNEQPKTLKNDFPHLLKCALDEINKTYFDNVAKLETPEGKAQLIQWNRFKYKSNVDTKILKYFSRKRDKAINELNEHLKLISSQEDFKTLVINVEWKDSKMWRANPRSSTNYGFTSCSIGGCGYDKGSTATAYALNSDLRLIKLIYTFKESILKQVGENPKSENTYYSDDNKQVKRIEPATQSDINRKYIGYGSGYGVLPRFEGGVGVDCHRRICETLGLNWEHTANGKMFDVYRISPGVKICE